MILKLDSLEIKIFQKSQQELTSLRKNLEKITIKLEGFLIFVIFFKFN